MRTAPTALAALTIACCLALPAPAAEPAVAELPTLRTLIIVSGQAKIPNAVTVLPDDAALVAAHFPGASFASNRETLVIGVESESAGTLAKIAFKSDCPNNSQFEASIEESFAARDELREALVTWTRHRHEKPGAPLLVVNEFKYGGGRGNFDVQLKIDALSAR